MLNLLPIAFRYMNFTSAYELNFYYQLQARQIAVGGYYRLQWQDGINSRLRATLLEMEGRKERLGIVAMDFPELGADDLIPALIQSNFDIAEPRKSCLRLVCLVGLILLVFATLLLVDIWTGSNIQLHAWTNKSQERYG